MAIAANFPSIKPSLSLDFANVGRLDPRVTFARASTARYYDGVTTAKAEENLLLESQDFTTSWTNANTTDTADTTVAPDGTTTADTITDDATSGPHNIYQTISGFTTNTSYVFSCWLKAGTSDYASLNVYDPATSQRYFAADFDLNAGTVRTSGAGTSGTLTSSSITEIPASSGWYRCVIIGELAAAGTIRASVAVSDGTTALNTFGNIVYSGTGSTIIAWGAQVEQRSAVTAYTATTTQPITNYVPVLLTAQNNEARFDHTPTTGAALGLEIEEQRTNLLTYSAEFNNAAWAKTNTTFTADTIVAPDGSLTGDKMIASSTSGTHTITQGTVTSGTTYVFSVYAKAGEYSQLQLSGMGAEGQGFNTVYNLATQTVTSAPTGSSITSVGNGWYRCVLIITASATGGPIIRIRDDSGNNNFAGNDFNGIFLWGAQLEAGAVATSYIPTTTTALTRSADLASMTGTAFSDWFNAGEGTLYADWQVPNATASCNIFSISDGTTNNRFQHYSESSLILVRTSASGVSANNSVGTSAANTAFRVAFGYGSGTTSASDNGSAITTTTQTLPTTLTALYIGASANGTAGQASTIRKIAYYPARLTDAQLQALTG